MRLAKGGAILLSVIALVLKAQDLAPEEREPAVEESYEPYTEHPRLLLTSAKLRLLRRERERQSARWQQFESLIQGGANMPEKGLAHGLYYQVTGDRSAANQAITWALTAGADLRQAALVYDWCQPALSPANRSGLLAKLTRALTPAAEMDPAAARDRAFAAIALAGDAPGPAPASVLRDVITRWWRKEAAPGWRTAGLTWSRPQMYATLELLHAVRHNLNIDLREDAGRVFMEAPAELLLSYYPAVYPAAENDYRIPVYDGDGEPDLRTAAIARAAELAFVAYDPNLRNSQFLQGWLMHDRFALRGAFGAPYEFLWANPYLPGLSFYHMPLFFHNEQKGELYARSSWDEDATWIGYRQGRRAQVYRDGKRFSLQPESSALRGLDIGDVTIVAAGGKLRIERAADSPPNVFVVGLKPRHWYRVEVDDEELAEAATDAGGILGIPSTRTDARVILIREP